MPTDNYQLAMSRIHRIIDLVHYSTSRCDGCGQTVYWILHRGSGAKTSYNYDGSGHLLTCPKPRDPRRSRQGSLL